MVQSQQITVARGLAIIVLATMQNMELAANAAKEWTNKRSQLAHFFLGAEWTRKEAVQECSLMAGSVALLYSMASLFFIL